MPKERCLEIDDSVDFHIAEAFYSAKTSGVR
jgi:CMP-N-acetylneuraminic acid synthetase